MLLIQPAIVVGLIHWKLMLLELVGRRNVCSLTWVKGLAYLPVIDFLPSKRGVLARRLLMLLWILYLGTTKGTQIMLLIRPNALLEKLLLLLDRTLVYWVVLARLNRVLVLGG